MQHEKVVMETVHKQRLATTVYFVVKQICVMVVKRNLEFVQLYWLLLQAPWSFFYKLKCFKLKLWCNEKQDQKKKLCKKVLVVVCFSLFESGWVSVRLSRSSQANATFTHPSFSLQNKLNQENI
jgi:hypothetical protein